MSETLWAQRPAADADAPRSVIWRAAPATLTEPTRLRRQLRAQLIAHFPDSAEDVEWLLLAFEELTTNGLRHGR